MARKSKMAQEAAQSEVGMEAYFDEVDSDEVADALAVSGYQRVGTNGAYRKEVKNYEPDFESMFD